MVTPVTGRRLAHAVVALAITGPAVLLGGTAWADDPTPAPADDTTVEAPLVEPSIGTWIIGGTLLEGTASKPAAKPAAKPATKPVVAPRTTTRTSSRTTTRKPKPSSGIGTAISTSTTPDGATVLPFTGNRVDALLPVGVAMLVGGVVLTFVARPRRAIA